MTAKLFVGNLSWSATEDELKQLFSEAGEAVSVRIVTDPYTGRSKGFGFVEMADEQACNTAIEKFDNFELQGRPIRVSRARQENASGGAPRHRGGGGGDRGERRFGPRSDRGDRGNSYAGSRGAPRQNPRYSDDEE